MSSIERAMDKLAGGDEVSAPVQPEHSAAAPRPEPAVPPPPPAVEESAVEAEAIGGVETRGAGVALEHGETPALAGVGALSRVDRDEPPRATSRPSDAAADKHRNSVVPLDFERMSAAGFLTPGQPIDRQAEEFQRIKRRLLGNLVPEVYQSARPANLILITSSVPGEGKTFTSVNLSISIAMEVDHTVLAIDTDIMKRDMSKVFGVAARPGLFDLLADPGLRLEDLLVRTAIPNLTILPAGQRREKSTEMLASQRMQELTDEISARYRDRVVIFDSPPILAMTTAAALAPLVGQVLIVSEAGNTKHETIKEALQRLEGIPITGVILNKSKQAYAPGYDYYGAYYYQAH